MFEHQKGEVDHIVNLEITLPNLSYMSNNPLPQETRNRLRCPRSAPASVGKLFKRTTAKEAKHHGVTSPLIPTYSSSTGSRHGQYCNTGDCSIKHGKPRGSECFWAMNLRRRGASPYVIVGEYELHVRWDGNRVYLFCNKHSSLASFHCNRNKSSKAMTPFRSIWRYTRALYKINRGFHT